ncbi:MAG TPA: hypothetical protein VFA37_07255 [Gaiellaceae bacterium]|nr:hypothetical protein [Gaiellaceae bacterium]
MTSTKERVADAAANARPYVERALRDRELRQNVRNAYSSARSVYDELIGRHGVTDVATRLATDDSVRDELKKAIDELRAAAGRVQSVAKEESDESGRSGRNGLLLVLGITIGLLFNPLTGPPLRRWLGRKLFGKSSFAYRDSNGTPLN